MGPVEQVEDVTGPSRISKESSKGKKWVTKGKGKGKGKEVPAFEEDEGIDGEWVMRRRCITAKLAEKKVDLEILCREIEVLEAMIEE